MILAEYFFPAGVIILLMAVACTRWTHRRFVKEREKQFETVYYNLIRDAFQNNENHYQSLMQGLDVMISNKPKKAIRIFTDLLKEAETSNELYAVKILMSQCCDLMEQYEEEVALCQDAISMDGDRIYAWFHMGTACIMLGKYKKAIEALEHAAFLVNEEAWADNIYASLAAAYTAAEKYVEAKKYIDLAYELNHHKDIASFRDMIEDAVYSLTKKMDGVEVTPLFKQMVEMIGYPYSVFSGSDVSREEAMEIYRKSLRKGKIKGFVPIFVADDILISWMDRWEDVTDMPYDQYVKSKAEAVRQLPSGKEMGDKYFMELTQPNEEYEVYDLEELTGDFTEGDRQDSFESLLYGMRFCLFEVPVKHPWEVLLYVPSCIWERPIMQEEAMAISKYWYEKYRAIPAFVSFEMIEFAVPDPVPESEAFEVAKQIFAFCPDRVTEATVSGTLGELADSIRRSKVWYLWWE